MNNKVSRFFLLLALGFSPLIHAEIELSELPLKAQQAIIKHMNGLNGFNGGKVSKIKRQKINLMNHGGEEEPTDLYLARVDGPKGKKAWIVVSKEGQLIDIEDEEEIILEDEAEKKKQKDTKTD